jgi:hypothetical protein
MTPTSGSFRTGLKDFGSVKRMRCKLWAGIVLDHHTKKSMSRFPLLPNSLSPT